MIAKTVAFTAGAFAALSHKRHARLVDGSVIHTSNSASLKPKFLSLAIKKREKNNEKDEKDLFTFSLIDVQTGTCNCCFFLLIFSFLTVELVSAVSSLGGNKWKRK